MNDALQSHACAAARVLLFLEWQRAALFACCDHAALHARQCAREHADFIDYHTAAAKRHEQLCGSVFPGVSP